MLSLQKNAIPLFALTLALIGVAATASANSSSAKEMKLVGKAFFMDSFRSSGKEMLIQEGTITSVSPACLQHIDEFKLRPTGFSAGGMMVSEEQFTALNGCTDVVVELDLAGSSFCKNQGGLEIYYAPKVIDVQCQ